LATGWENANSLVHGYPPKDTDQSGTSRELNAIAQLLADERLCATNLTPDWLDAKN
jgi:hypothetical protein